MQIMAQHDKQESRVAVREASVVGQHQIEESKTSKASREEYKDWKCWPSES